MIRIGTRGSALALWQARHIAGLIGKNRTEIIIIKTKGDKIRNVSFDKMEGKGFFTKEIEDSLLEGRVDCAIHSLKDLPVENTPGLTLAAITKREDPSDVLLIRSDRYDPGNSIPVVGSAVIGTSSLRRSVQILHEMNSLTVKPLRGNVTTRVKKLREKKYDAIILARAGIKRLGTDLTDIIDFTLPYSYFLPAPGQGALAVQVREKDHILRKDLNFLNDENTALAVKAERAFLNRFGAGCHAPLGALGYLEDGEVRLSGVVSAACGSGLVRETATGGDPEELGERLARLIIEKGGGIPS